MDLTPAVDAVEATPPSAEQTPSSSETPAVPAPGKGGKPAAAAAKPEDDKYEYEIEVEEDGEDGKPVKKKVKEALTKQQVNEILARRKRLDTAAFKRLEHLNKVYNEQIAPFEERVARVKDNPVEALEFLAERAGVDPLTITTAFAQRFMQQLEMTPDQRAAEQHRSQVDKLRGENEQLRQKEEQREYDQKLEQFATGERKRMIEAHSAVGLPKHPLAFKLMHAHAASQARAGIERPDYGLAAEETKEFLQDAARSWLATLDYEGLVTALPKEVADTLRKGDLARVAPAPGSPRSAAAAPAPRKQKAPPTQPFLNPQQWRKKIMGG